MEKTGELDSMLTELDSPAASSEPAQPNKKKLPEPDASYAMPGAPTSETFERERKPRQQLKRSNTWVKRVTGEDLVETAKKRKTICWGMLVKPPAGWIRAAKMVSPLVAIAALTAVGNIAYALLEEDSEAAQQLAYQSFLTDLLETTNISDAQFEVLLSYTGKAHLPQQEDSEAHADADMWGFPNHHTFYFSFSIISTIGYGSIVPVTSGGKMFTVAYSLIGIPFCVTAVSICAAEVLYLFEWLAVSRMDQVRMAFESYDVDSSNALDLTEFRAALSDLGINPKEEDFEALVEEIDEDHSRTLDLSEFKRTATMLGLPLGRVARTKVRLQISVLVSVGWLFLGMFAVRAIEGWAYIDSFYFSVMTLTTVGLGDFVPTSQAGTVFGFFYCMVGLGLIALLVTAIGDFSDAVRNKAEQKAAAAVVAAASRAARELHAVGQSTGKLLNKTSDRLHKNQTGGWRSGRSSPTAAALALAAGDGKDQEEEEDTLAGRIMQTQQIDATDERSEMHGVHGMMGRLTEDAPVRMDGTAVPVLTEAEEKADDIMDAFDKNNDGVLDASEVAAIARLG